MLFRSREKHFLSEKKHFGTRNKMVFVEIDEGLEMGKGYWKFNTSNLRDQKYNDEIKQTWAEIKEMKTDFDNMASKRRGL